MVTKIKKIWIVRILLFIATAISLMFVPWIIVKAWIIPISDSVETELNRSVNYGFYDSILYIEKEGKEEIYIVGDVKKESLFKIASIEKLFDALSIAKLVSSGDLDLNKTVADYFPNLKSRIQYSDEITLKMLVEHRSGIPNYTDTYNYWGNPPDNYIDKLELILDKPADFKPGSKYRYNNTNYLLLGKLIENVTGSSKFNYIKKEILDPLNMNDTYESLKSVDLDNLMSGYYVGVEADIKANEYGGMISTVSDIGRLIRSLNNGSIFNNDEESIYKEIYVFEHSGLMPGYQSFAKYYKDIDTVVVMVTNRTDFNGYNWNLSQVILGRIAKVLRKS